MLQAWLHELVKDDITNNLITFDQSNCTWKQQGQKKMHKHIFTNHQSNRQEQFKVMMEVMDSMLCR